MSNSRVCEQASLGRWVGMYVEERTLSPCTCLSVCLSVYLSIRLSTQKSRADAKLRPAHHIRHVQQISVFLLTPLPSYGPAFLLSGTVCTVCIYCFTGLRLDSNHAAAGGATYVDRKESSSPRVSKRERCGAARGPKQLNHVW